MLIRHLKHFLDIFKKKTFILNSNQIESYWMSRSDNFNQLNSFQTQRLQFLINNLPEHSKIIDVGSGPGLIIYKLKLQKLIQELCLDGSIAAIEQARTLNLNAELFNLQSQSIGNISFEADYIIFFEILEHLPNPEDVLIESLDKAREGVIFSVPNTGYIVHRLRLLFGKFPIQWKIFPGEHLRFWTVSDMLLWLKCLNLEIVKHHYYEGLPILNKIFPSLFSMGQIYLVKKKKS